MCGTIKLQTGTRGSEEHLRNVMTDTKGKRNLYITSFKVSVINQLRNKYVVFNKYMKFLIDKAVNVGSTHECVVNGGLYSSLGEESNLRAGTYCTRLHLAFVPHLLNFSQW